MLVYSLFTFIFLLMSACRGDNSRWHVGNEMIEPLYYLGDTPYQNESFSSANISTAIRIQRDIAMNVTIDQLVWPSIDMSNSFFGKDYSAKKLSQVDQPLIMGYKRLVIDIYWDSIKLDWQLCPIQITNTTSDTKFNGYTCTPNFMLEDFLASVNDYLVSTETDTSPEITSLITLILNLHEIPLNTTQQKRRETNLGDIIKHTISTNQMISRIYTPANLTVDRNNVSASFYAHGLEPYFPLHSSPWPQWLYLVEKKIQLLIGFGTIDQNTSFTISPKDQSIIFDPISLGGIGGGMNLSINTPIQQPPHCTLEPISWSFINDHANIFTYDAALQVSQCGYSPYFTHSNYSTNSSEYTKTDSGHLADNVLSTIWSWDINEPNTNDGRRCAAIKSSNGRWIAYDCAETLRVACRLAVNPNEWVLTKNSFIYDRALSACPTNYVFDIPRIPRQNIHLRNAMRAQNLTTEDNVWLNLNLLYTDDSCWVIGRYGSCWWSPDVSHFFM